MRSRAKYFVHFITFDRADHTLYFVCLSGLDFCTFVCLS